MHGGNPLEKELVLVETAKNDRNLMDVGQGTAAIS
jgi:hypothetical protein